MGWVGRGGSSEVLEEIAWIRSKSACKLKIEAIIHLAR